jgi:hypothetical protein
MKVESQATTANPVILAEYEHRKVALYPTFRTKVTWYYMKTL